MVSVGEARALMRWKAITLTILATAITLGSFWGKMGIVLAHCLSGLFIRMPGFLIYSSRYQPIKASEFFKSLYPVFLSAMATLLVVMLLRNYFTFENDLISVISFSLISLSIYSTALALFARTRLEIKDSVGLFKSLLLKFL